MAGLCPQLYKDENNSTQPWLQGTQFSGREVQGKKQMWQNLQSAMWGGEHLTPPRGPEEVSTKGAMFVLGKHDYSWSGETEGKSEV